VEDKANGPAVIQELRHDVAGLIEVTPEGGKHARAHAVSPVVESGNVYLPHPDYAPWVETLIEEMAAFPNGRHDDQVDAMTQALKRLREYGGVFGVPESQIVVNPFPIPEDWPQGFGMAIQPGGVAALWGALDPSGTLYLFAEHQSSHAEPGANALAIKQLGAWIPGVLHSASLPGSMAARDSIAQIYRKQGLTLYTPKPAEEAAVYQLWQLLAAHKIRVFASLAGFLAAYRIGDEEALLLRCCQALILEQACMKKKPVPQPRESWLELPRGEHSWMAL